MADTKVSDLTAASAEAAADLLYLVQGGQSKKITIANFLSHLDVGSGQTAIFNSIAANADLQVQGLTDPNIIFVDADAPSTNTAWIGGSVGIGTQTPDQKLRVVGNAKIDGYFQFNPSVAGPNTWFTANAPVVINTQLWGASTFQNSAGNSTRALPAGQFSGQDFWYFFYNNPGSGNSNMHTLTSSVGSGWSTVTFNISSATGTPPVVRFNWSGTSWQIFMLYAGTSGYTTAVS